MSNGPRFLERHYIVWWMFAVGWIRFRNNQRRLEVVLQTAAVCPSGTAAHPEL